MNDILDIFEFKKEEFTEKQANVLLSMLSKEEKKVFNFLKLTEEALTATQIYDYYIDKIITDNPKLKKKIDELKHTLNNKNKTDSTKKSLEIKAEFARKNKVQVPTNRTITRVLENLKDAGFVVKRNTHNKRAKAYYCLIPRLKIILEDLDEDLIKKREIDQMRSRLKKIKTIIKDQK